MPMHRWSGWALVLAGVSVALWTLVHPWGTVAGPEVGSSGGWALAHTFHFLGGFLGAFGLLGLVSRYPTAPKLEKAGFLLAFAGTVLFSGTGVITAFIWPVLAVQAPAMVEHAGPFFTPPHPIIGVTAVLFSAGWAMLSIALARAGILSRVATGVLVLGALVLLPPPPPLSPVPWILFPLGGFLMGLGIATVGLAIGAGRTLAPRTA